MRKMFAAEVGGQPPVHGLVSDSLAVTVRRATTRPLKTTTSDDATRLLHGSRTPNSRSWSRL